MAGLRRPESPAEPAVEQTDDVAEETEETVETTEPAGAVRFDDTVETEESPEESAEESLEEREIVSEPVIGGSPEPEDDETEMVAKPSGKHRSTGVTKPIEETAEVADDEDDKDDEEGDTESEESTKQRAKGLNAAIAVGLVALLFAGLALWFAIESNNLTGDVDENNQALTNVADTEQVKAQMTDAIGRTFSYNYTDLESTKRVVREKLAGKALCEYEQLFGVVHNLAPGQQSVMTTTVREIGVTRLEGDLAELLVFVDQNQVRTATKEQNASGAQFGVKAERDNGVWKIVEFDMFGQTLSNGQPAPKC